MMNVLSLAQQLLPWSIKHRQFLHQYPELALKEFKTSAYCKKILEDLGYTITTLWETGFIAHLNLGHYRTIAYRADMDALPIQELSNHNYKSAHSGVAHMCGHDSHMAIALTTARILVERKNSLKVNIRFIFQPSEEVLPGGAKSMIEHGCLEGVSAIYGLHNDPKTQVGIIRCLEGAMTAGCDVFTIIVNGKGGHASSPHTALDPVSRASLLVNEINTIRSRHLAPMHPAVISITNFHAGDAENIIPDQATLRGIIRSFDQSDRLVIKKMMTMMVRNTHALGYNSTIDFTESYPSIINTLEGQQIVISAASSLLPSSNIISTGYPEAWGEDFAYYLHHSLGAFFILGSGNTTLEINSPLHSPHFNIDENSLAIGAAVMSQISLSMI